MVSVCVPVLKRYDLLARLLMSLEGSTVKVDRVVVVNNGRDVDRLKVAMRASPVPFITHTPDERLGLAETWNWFIDTVPKERIITNDDIEFAPHSIEAMLRESVPFVSCTYGFSCFLIRDECVNRVGYFDETISPGYAYFEDMDYLRRMKLAGVVDAVVDCGVRHVHSATPATYSPEEWANHHRRFIIAQSNYSRKWGEPSWDQLEVIGGAGANTAKAASK